MGILDLDWLTPLEWCIARKRHLAALLGKKPSEVHVYSTAPDDPCPRETQPNPEPQRGVRPLELD